MDNNSNIKHPDLYKQAVEIADKIYIRPTSAYKSMFIHRKYQQLGGSYKGKKKSLTGRWREERWIQVKPYLELNKIIECGDNNKKNKVCRPLKRVNEKTPITILELLKLHSKEDLLKLTNKKIKDMNGRVMWKQMKFIPSK